MNEPNKHVSGPDDNKEHTTQLTEEIGGTPHASGARAPDLRGFLVPHPQNTDNLDRLLDLTRRGQLVSFVGAGVSKPLGIPDWEKLMKDLLNYAKNNLDRHDDLPPELPKDSKTWPEVADQVHGLFQKANRGKDYFNEISKRMKPLHNTTTLTLVKLVLAIRTHLTTNFDTSIEKAYDFLEYLSKKFNHAGMAKSFVATQIPDFGDYRRERADVIHYLHANTEQNLYVLKKADYDLYYPTVSGQPNSDDRLEQCLKYYYEKSSIVFIGFSFQDQYVRKFFISLAERMRVSNQESKNFYAQAGRLYAARDIRHFLLIASDNEEFVRLGKEIYARYSSYNIYPIVYERDRHLFLEHLFETLSWGKPWEKSSSTR